MYLFSFLTFYDSAFVTYWNPRKQNGIEPEEEEARLQGR